MRMTAAAAMTAAATATMTAAAAAACLSQEGVHLGIERQDEKTVAFLIVILHQRNIQPPHCFQKIACHDDTQSIKIAAFVVFFAVSVERKSPLCPAAEAHVHKNAHGVFRPCLHRGVA